MNGVKFKDQTGEYGKPSTMSDAECSSLPIKKTMNGKFPSIESVWELSDQELEEVIKSKRIRVGVLSEGILQLMYVSVEQADNK